MLMIEVSVMGGADIAEACEELCVLASRLGCIVEADMNGVKAMAKPGCDPRELFRLWESALGSSRPHKIVCAQPIHLQRVWESEQHTADHADKT